MCVTEDINTFASIYHNKKDISISCVIYNNVNNLGVNEYRYNDKRKDTTVTYYGQNQGRFDKYMVGGSTLYLEKPKHSKEYKYIGLVTHVTCVRKTLHGQPNEYELKLDVNHIQNGYKSGDKLRYDKRFPRGEGRGRFKKSSLWRLSLDYGGNMFSGIIPTTPLIEI